MRVDASGLIFPLRRRGAGEWASRDERWEFIADPNGYPELGIGADSGRLSRHAWYIFPAKGRHPGADCDHPVFVGGTRAWATLKAAARALRAAEEADVEPAPV